MAARYQFLIFDLDGTLIDSSLDLTAAAGHAMRQMGFPEREVAEIRGFVGDGARKLVERSLPEGQGEMIERGVELFLGYYARHLLDRTRPYAQVPEMLDALAGIPKAIATNKPERFAREIVKGLGWDAIFNEVLGGDSLARRKPDALVVRTLCQRLAISPVGTLVVGDGPQDMGAATAAGATGCGVSWGFHSAEQLRRAGAQVVIEHPLDLVQLL